MAIKRVLTAAHDAMHLFANTSRDAFCADEQVARERPTGFEAWTAGGSPATRRDDSSETSR